MNDLDERLARLRQRHDAGDRLAAGECLVVCQESGTPPPAWVLSAHACAWKKYLEGDHDLPDAYFGPRLDGGRHADLRRQREEREQYERVYAAVRGAEMAGGSGSKRFEIAVRILAELGSGRQLEVEQVQKIYYRQAKRAPEQSVWYNDPTRQALTCSGLAVALSLNVRR